MSIVAAGDCAKARDEAIDVIGNDDTKVDRASAKEDTLSLAGRQAMRTRYAAKNGASARTAIVMVAALDAARCLQVAEWGAPKSVSRYEAEVQNIFATIKPTK